MSMCIHLCIDVSVCVFLMTHAVDCVHVGFDVSVWSHLNIRTCICVFYLKL